MVCFWCDWTVYAIERLRYRERARIYTITGFDTFRVHSESVHTLCGPKNDSVCRVMTEVSSIVTECGYWNITDVADVASNTTTTTTMHHKLCGLAWSTNNTRQLNWWFCTKKVTQCAAQSFASLCVGSNGGISRFMLTALLFARPASNVSTKNAYYTVCFIRYRTHWALYCIDTSKHNTRTQLSHASRMHVVDFMVNNGMVLSA